MKRILGFLRPYRTESVLGPLFKMLEALFELFVPLVVADIIDNGIASGDQTYILKRCGLMVLLGFVGLACSITAQFFSAKAAVGMAAGLRRALFAHIGKLSFSKSDQFGPSTLLTRTTADINQIQTATNMVLRLFMRSPFIVFGAMIMAFTVSPYAAMTFVVTIPALSLVVFGIMSVSIPLFRRVQARLDRVLGLTREAISGARVVRAFVRKGESVDEFVTANKALVRFQRFVGRFSALLNPLTYVIINLSILAIIWRGGVQVSHGDLSQGEVIALYNYMSQILVELIKMANFIILIMQALACVSRVNRILDTEAGMPAQDGAFACGEQENAVEFRDVTLCYHADAAPSLSHVSFCVKRGETVGIIGGTGSGKSSLVHLIPRFYDASEGAVLVQGRDVRAFADVKKLREKIGIVPQKAELFAGSIRENLQMGKEDATEAELWQALETASAADFVKEKEGGLDFALEQGGRNLSGGQKQRLCIARALVRAPEILILDDSASALDYATDAAVRKALHGLSYHPTTFIVSQRTASIRHADLILVLEDGQIVGIGKHDALLQTCEVYREIYDSQFSAKEVSAQ